METKNKARLLAELTELLQPEKSAKNVPSSTDLQEILSRLAALENKITDHQRSANKLTSALHPSQRKFEIAEANEIFLPGTKDKACRFEPNKPCDYCSMCSAQGF